MKINENFILRQVADTWVVLPIGAATVDFNGMMTLNDAGVLLWQTLEKGSDREGLIAALCGVYDVSRECALADVDAFLEKLAQVGCIEEYP